MDLWEDGIMEEWINERMEYWKNGLMKGWKDGFMRGWKDERMYKWGDGRVEGCKDEYRLHGNVWWLDIKVNKEKGESFSWFLGDTERET